MRTFVWHIPRPASFQTLPGVILHFYEKELHAPGNDAVAQDAFQTLPGVILHFYTHCLWNLQITRCAVFLSNPSRGYSAFLLRSTVRRWRPGFSGESSNPSRGYSAFLLTFSGGRIKSEAILSNPSRGYSAFLRSLRCSPGAYRVLSNPSRGYSAFLHTMECTMTTILSDPYRFKPFQGLFCISTQCFRHCDCAGDGDISFQTLPGVILHFYFTEREMEGYKILEENCSNPSRGYSAFLPPATMEMPVGSFIRTMFKPFQGLFCISTPKLHAIDVQTV